MMDLQSASLQILIRRLNREHILRHFQSVRRGELYPRWEFQRRVQEARAERHARGFTCWGQFVAMLFCQLGRASASADCGRFATAWPVAKESRRTWGSRDRAARPWPTLTNIAPGSCINKPSCVGAGANALKIQIWTALMALLILKFLQLRSQWGGRLSNLVALLRLNLFTHRNLWHWIDHPLEPPPTAVPLVQQLQFSYR